LTCDPSTSRLIIEKPNILQFYRNNQLNQLLTTLQDHDIDVERTASTYNFVALGTSRTITEIDHAARPVKSGHLLEFQWRNSGDGPLRANAKDDKVVGLSLVGNKTVG